MLRSDVDLLIRGRWSVPLCLLKSGFAYLIFEPQSALLRGVTAALYFIYLQEELRRLKPSFKSAALSKRFIRPR